MGLIVDVYRPARGGDCTLGGISGRHATLCVVNVEGPFEPGPDRPAAWLLDRSDHRGSVGPLPPVVVPAEATVAGGRPGWTPADDHWMNGGNFAASSDSRWTAAVGSLGNTAVSIHDRSLRAEQEREDNARVELEAAIKNGQSLPDGVALLAGIEESG